MNRIAVNTSLSNTPFLTFAKGGNQKKTITNNCVIYTRVSDRKQLENLSLEVQLKYTQQFAEKKGLVVRSIFGETAESAKTDERKEFQRMLDFVNKKKNEISYIIVYSLERFSRSENSIWLVTQLRKLGVELLSVIQPIDTTDFNGQFQQKMLLLFGEQDNNLRRQKCMAGTKERLLKGEWCNTAPIGYDHIRVNGERRIVVNEKGKLIRKAFYWKMNEDCTLTEIKRRLEKKGLKLRRIGLVAEILKNPFYCGIITHRALEGQVVEGRHEKLISKEVFLKVNKLYEQNSKAGFKVNIENDKLPLKRFLRCAGCNKPLRGYIASKGSIPYYKCNNPGCKNNRNANHLHGVFLNQLQNYTIDSRLKPIIQDRLSSTIKNLIDGQEETQKALQAKYDELSQKIDRLEERFVLEEITSEQYHKFAAKFKNEQYQISQQLEKSKAGGSNREKAVEKIMQLCLNLPSLWQKSNYTNKQKLQFLVFPDGIEYNREKDQCRTLTVNPVFSYVAHIAKDLTGGGNEDNKNLDNLPIRSTRAQSKGEERRRCFYNSLIFCNLWY